VEATKRINPQHTSIHRSTLILFYFFKPSRQTYTVIPQWAPQGYSAHKRSDNRKYYACLLELNEAGSYTPQISALYTKVCTAYIVLSSLEGKIHPPCPWPLRTSRQPRSTIPRRSKKDYPSTTHSRCLKSKRHNSKTRTTASRTGRTAMSFPHPATPGKTREKPKTSTKTHNTPAFAIPRKIKILSSSFEKQQQKATIL